MESFAEIVPQVVLRIFAPLLGACVVAWVIMLFVQCFSGKLHSCRFTFAEKGSGESAASPRCGLGKAVCAGLVALAIACTTLCGKNTNGVNGVGGMYLMQFNPPVVQSVTPENISNGWRVAEVSDVGAFAPPPANAVTNERWRLRGAHDDAFRIPADGWSYPYASGITVLSRGEIRTSIRAHDFPPAFDQDLSLVPNFNWSLLPEGRQESAFWYGASPSNTLLATWWNAALGREATNPVCFQAELYTNGGFDYRYEDRTVRHVRVWPFDLDDDGLENSVDPDPLVAGPDAHGTNAEWYNTVCSNVLETVAGDGGASGTPCPTLSWREEVNSNAYYFVDVIATNGPAPIYFTGDRESRLGNPVVVARAFETNRVPLLIGINYAVTSTVPISISIPYEGFATITTNSVSNYNVRWPLEFNVLTDGIGYRVSAVPYDPGCEFQWPTPMRFVTCNYTTDGGWIGFSCCWSGNCGCSGCSVAGEAVLEDTSFDLPDVWCGCWHYNPFYPGVGPSLTNMPPVFASFDKSVVFYEDAYTNVPNDVVAKHSTNTTLTVFAYGGEDGRMLYVSDQNIGKLVRTGGKAITFPYTAFVPPNSGMSFSIEYEAETHSDSEGDITVTASITPGDGGGSVSASATTTVVKVLLETQYGAPCNGNRYRHTYGVNELVICKWQPMSLPVTWSASAGGSIDFTSGFPWFKAPIRGGGCTIVATAGSESFQFNCLTVEPEKFYCERVAAIDSGLGTNIAGGVGMSLELYIKPLTVSFGNIALQEVPTDTGQVWGYFLNNAFSHMWAHTRDNRAGQWHNVGSDNLFMLNDEAILEGDLPPVTPDGTLTNDISFGWIEGGIVWSIPLGWNNRNMDEEDLPVRTNAVPEQQRFVINSEGTLGVVKAGHYVLRGTNTQITTGRLVE